MKLAVTRETHECPRHIQNRVAAAGGTNHYGEPNFRVVWSGARLAHIGGWWTDRAENGDITREVFELREVPKYMPPWDRWIVESYRPPEWYGSPLGWEMVTREYAFPQFKATSPSLLSMGAFPNRGDYEMCQILDIVCDECWERVSKLDSGRQPEKLAILGACQDRQFLPLTSHVVLLVTNMIRRSREATNAQIKREIRATWEAQQKVLDQTSADRFDAAHDKGLTKEQKERVERIVAPAIERQLAAQVRAKQQVSPLVWKRMMENKAFTFNN